VLKKEALALILVPCFFMKSLKQILDERTGFSGRFSKHEFQVFGYQLALNLGDLAHKSLYIRLAKEEDRILLEKALGFVKDSKAKSKAKLFMWAVKQLRQTGQIGVGERKDPNCEKSN